MQRIPVRFSTNSVKADGHIKNLSKEGVFVRANVLPFPGDHISIRFESRQGSKLEILGTVRWTTAQINDPEITQPGFGVQLDQKSPDYDAFFEEVLLS